MKKTLFFIPSPRNIAAVWDWINRVDHVDKLIVKNFQWDTAMDICKSFLSKRPEYDYYLSCTDDVMGCPDQVDMLVKDLEENDFSAVCGWCGPHGATSVAIKPPDLDVFRASLEKPYPGLRRSDYDFVTAVDLLMGKYGYPFVKSWFTGGPLLLMRRDAWIKVPWRPWRLLRDRHCITARGKRDGRAVMSDITFAIDCAEQGVSLMTDVRVHLYHIPHTRGMLRVGRDKPKIFFVPAEGERTDEELAEINALLGDCMQSAWNSEESWRTGV